MRTPMHRYKFLLVSSLLLIVTGFVLTGFAIFSPLWQIMELPQGYQTHQHGIWWDCVVSTARDEKIIPLNQVDQAFETKGEVCVSKFDPSNANILRTALDNGDQAAKELMSHRFLPQHKAVVFFTVFVIVFGVFAIIIGACSPCFPPNSLIYILATFMTSVCSFLADALYILGCIRPTELNNMFQFKFGLACYTHLLASAVFSIALILSILSSYLLISHRGAAQSCCTSKTEYVEQQRWRATLERGATCDRKHCRPFMVVDDDSSV